MAGTPVFTLVDNAGGRFALVGNNLQVASALDYEVATSHTVVVGVSGVEPPVANQTITINVTNVARIVLLSNNVMHENIAVGTPIGALTVQDGIGTYTFTVIDDPDNLFTVDSANLDKEGLLDLDVATSHIVTIQADNGAGDVVTQTFTINVVP